MVVKETRRFPKVNRRVFLFAAAAAVGFAVAGRAVPATATGTGSPASPGPTTTAATAVAAPAGVAFDAFVLWDYRRRDNLSAWRTTAHALANAVAAAAADPKPGSPVIENGGPAELRKFCAGAGRRAPISVVYLAAHQAVNGAWEFLDGSKERVGAVVGAMPPHPARFVIVDACHAAALVPDLLARPAAVAGVLAASRRGEEAHELSYRRPWPIDLRQRYPRLGDWLGQTLGPQWDGRLSFLGFVWLECWRARAAPPGSVAEWRAFMADCERFAAEFARGRGRRLATELRYFEPE